MSKPADKNEYFKKLMGGTLVLPRLLRRIAIREADDTYFAATPPERWSPWVVITQPAWSQAPATSKQAYEEVSRTKGWNYADGGRIVEVLVLRRRPG